jgi:hypothetical protein
MKKTFFLLLIVYLFNCNLGNSQSENTYNKQIAFDGRALLTGLLLDIPTSPYQVVLKSYGSERNKRLLLGVNFNATFNAESTSFTGLTRLALRAGKERFEDFGAKNKWRVLYGVDGVANVSFTQQASNFRYQLGAGVAPFAGLQFRINNRLSIFTEVSYEILLNATSFGDSVVLALNGNFNRPTGLWIAFDLNKKKKG